MGAFGLLLVEERKVPPSSIERDAGEKQKAWFWKEALESCSPHSTPWDLGDAVGQGGPSFQTPSSPPFCPRVMVLAQDIWSLCCPERRTSGPGNMWLMGHCPKGMSLLDLTCWWVAMKALQVPQRGPRAGDHEWTRFTLRNVHNCSYQLELLI